MKPQGHRSHFGSSPLPWGWLSPAGLGGGAWGLCGCLAQGITASGIRGLRLVGGVRARVCAHLVARAQPSSPAHSPCTIVLLCYRIVLALHQHCTIVLPVLCLVLRPDSFIKLPVLLIYSLIWFLYFVATFRLGTYSAVHCIKLPFLLHRRWYLVNHLQFLAKFSLSQSLITQQLRLNVTHS